MKKKMKTPATRVPSPGVGLNRKSSRATWARKQKNLRAQPHIYEPNITRKISISHLNGKYPFHFAEKGILLALAAV